MSEIVDSIIAELIVRADQYVAGFDRATAAHERFKKSIPTTAALGGITDAEAKQYADRHTKAADAVAAGEERATEKVKRTRRARTDTVKQAERDEVAAIKQAGDAKVAAEEATQARLSAAVERGLARQRAATRPATNSRIGATVPREPTGQRSIPASALAGEAKAEVATEKEVNHLLADQYDLRARGRAAAGQTKREISDELEYLRRINAYKRAGLADDEAVLRAEAEIAAVERLRADTSRQQGLKGAARFAEGAGIGRSGGSLAAIGGIVTAGAVATVVELTKAGLDYATSLKTVSEQIGITTKQLQTLQTAGNRFGLTTQNLRESLTQVSGNLGRAQEGAEEQSKVFAKLGIDVGNAQTGYRSLRDVLPTIADRLSQITDQTRRNAIETALGGEQLRKLDPILRQGSAGLDQLSDSLERTGGILSSGEIDHAAKVSADLKRVGDQLERQLAGTVSQNADAILGLAQAFGVLAGRALQAVGALQRFGARVQANGGLAFATDESRKAGRDYLNQTASGRADNRQRITQARNELNALQQSNARSGFVTAIGNVANTPEGIAAARAKIRAYRGEVRAAADADREPEPVVQPGKVGDTSNLFAPKGPKGPSAETLAKQADQRQKRYEDELARLNDEYLSAKRELTVGTDAQLAIDQQGIEADRVRRNQDIQRQANEKQIDQAKVKELQNAEDAAAAERQKVLILRSQIEADRAALELRHQFADNQLQYLNDEQTFAKTAEERRRLALQAIRVQFDRQQEDLQAVVDSKDPSVTDAQRDAARTQLRELPDLRNSANRAARQQNLGTGASYLDGLRFNASDKRQFIEGEQVKLLDSFNRGLDDSTRKALQLHGIFGDIVGDLIDMAVKQALIKPLGNAFFGSGTGGSGGGGLFGSLLSAASALAGGNSLNAGGGRYEAGISPSIITGGRASGGNIVGGVPYDIGERGPERVIFPSSGNIVPNNVALHGSSPTIALTQHIQVDGRNSVTPADFADQIVATANAHANRVAASAGQKAVQAGPAYAAQVRKLDG